MSRYIRLIERWDTNVALCGPLTIGGLQRIVACLPSLFGSITIGDVYSVCEGSMIFPLCIFVISVLSSSLAFLPTLYWSNSTSGFIGTASLTRCWAVVIVPWCPFHLDPNFDNRLNKHLWYSLYLSAKLVGSRQLCVNCLVCSRQTVVDFVCRVPSAWGCFCRVGIIPSLMRRACWYSRRVATLYVRTRFALHLSGSCSGSFTRFLLTFLDCKRGWLCVGNDHKFWKMNEVAQKSIDYSIKGLNEKGSCSLASGDRCSRASFCGTRQIFISVVQVASSVRQQSWKVWRVFDTSEALVLKSRHWKKGRTATGFGCHVTTLRLLGKTPRMKRSTSSVSSNKLNARLEMNPNQTWVPRSPTRRCSSVVSQSLKNSFFGVQRCWRFAFSMRLVYSSLGWSLFIWLKPVRMSSKHSIGVRTLE